MLDVEGGPSSSTRPTAPSALTRKAWPSCSLCKGGYKRGGTRPVLFPVKGGGWHVKEMPTYSPGGIAGNSTRPPEDTVSRTIRVLLMLDLEGRVEESDWELIDQDARDRGERLAA
jgi:hypothetical protein